MNKEDIIKMLICVVMAVTLLFVIVSAKILLNGREAEKTNQRIENCEIQLKNYEKSIKTISDSVKYNSERINNLIK